MEDLRFKKFRSQRAIGLGHKPEASSAPPTPGAKGRGGRAGAAGVLALADHESVSPSCSDRACRPGITSGGREGASPRTAVTPRRSSVQPDRIRRGVPSRGLLATGGTDGIPPAGTTVAGAELSGERLYFIRKLRWPPGGIPLELFRAHAS